MREGCPSAYVNMCSDAAQRMSVSLVSPAGQEIPKVASRSDYVTEYALILEQSKISISYYFSYSNGFDQITAIKIGTPTPGLWKLTAHGDIATTNPGWLDKFHIWLPVDGQGGEYLSFSNPDPNATLTVPATSPGVISCTAYDTRDNSMYMGASRGPTRQNIERPDLAAPGVAIDGLFPSGYGAMSGTSAAAAAVAGVGALMMQWGVVDGNMPIMNTFSLRTILIRGCDQIYPPVALQYAYASGYGLLNLYNSFLRMQID